MVTLVGLIGRTIVLIVLASFLAAWFHELSHWLVGRAQTPNLNLEYRFPGFPDTVRYHDSDELSSRGLLLSSLAPQVILLPYALIHYLALGVPTMGYWVFYSNYADLIASSVFVAALFGGAIPSPADLIGAFCQEEFRNWDERGHEDRTRIERLKIFINCIRERQQ